MNECPPAGEAGQINLMQQFFLLLILPTNRPARYCLLQMIPSLSHYSITNLLVA